jgi:hypothetical protein
MQAGIFAGIRSTFNFWFCDYGPTNCDSKDHYDVRNFRIPVQKLHGATPS